MKAGTSDRRVAPRHNLKTPLRVRIWKSAVPAQRAKANNLSKRGIFFATDSPLCVGTTVEILLKMPEEVSGRPTAERLCSGHVVCVEPVTSPRGKLGVGVQLDCYQISQLKRPNRLDHL